MLKITRLYDLAAQGSDRAMMRGRSDVDTVGAKEKLLLRHLMQVPVERPAIAQIQKARVVATSQCVWHLGRQADECLAVEILLAAILGDVGEPAFQPNVGLVAAVAVIGYREMRWNPEQQLRWAFGKIASEYGDFGTRGQALELQRRPFQTACVRDHLLRP